MSRMTPAQSAQVVAAALLEKELPHHISPLEVAGIIHKNWNGSLLSGPGFLDHALVALAWIALDEVRLSSLDGNIEHNKALLDGRFTELHPDCFPVERAHIEMRRVLAEIAA